MKRSNGLQPKSWAWLAGGAALVGAAGYAVFVAKRKRAADKAESLRKIHKQVDDETLRDCVREELSQIARSPSNIHVEVLEGVVALEGTVQGSESDTIINSVRNLEGVIEVHNHLIAQSNHAELSEVT
jgi:hypothetical protein